MRPLSRRRDAVSSGTPDAIKSRSMGDRLRDLIELVVGAPPAAEVQDLARAAAFSPDHLARLLTRATGEPPAALRRRLLLERAAWQLRHGATAAEAAAAAGYGSQAAFTRAFARAFGAPPTRYDGGHRLPAPNGIHFHPPGGLLVPGPRTGRDVADRLLHHHLDRVRELLAVAARLPAQALERPLRPGFVVLGFEGEEASAAVMAERLVYTLEVWAAAIEGAPVPPAASGPLLPRFERAARAFARIAARIRDGGAYDDAFVDALCEPPQSFTYGSVLAHVLSFGAVRREALAGVLRELGAQVPSGDPIDWEIALQSRST
jgi:AraC family transcriptional regulator